MTFAHAASLRQRGLKHHSDLERYFTRYSFGPPPNKVGRRILYWVRGNYRVKDNLGLSVALWLSAQTQLPLQVSETGQTTSLLLGRQPWGQKCI